MGVGTILDARKVALLATGPAKAAVFARAVEGPITAMISASALQPNPHCTFIVDDDAATALTKLGLGATATIIPLAAALALSGTSSSLM